jgi:SAM-dependent methyltransferase
MLRCYRHRVPGRWAYNFLYRRGAPWEGGPRAELVHLVESGRLDPSNGPRAIDLGCGSGANVVFLAEHGFDATGVDFSPVALDKARALAHARGVSNKTRFVEADLTAPSIDGVDGRFDLVIDYGTIDDFRGKKRLAMARHPARLTRTGGSFLFWCFYASRRDLRWISFDGPSKLSGAIAPGEENALFRYDFSIERLPSPPPTEPFACFLMTRRAS